jgi:hypothetical protein
MGGEKIPDPETFTNSKQSTGKLLYKFSDTNDSAVDWISVTILIPGDLEETDSPDTVTVNFNASTLAAGDPSNRLYRYHN